MQQYETCTGARRCSYIVFMLCAYMYVFQHAKTHKLYVLHYMHTRAPETPVCMNYTVTFLGSPVYYLAS